MKRYRPNRIGAFDMNDPDIMPGESKSSDPQQMKPRIAITIGDPNGIGPEVVLKCLADSRLTKYFDPILVGSTEVFAAHARSLGFEEFRFHESLQFVEKRDDSNWPVVDISGDVPLALNIGHITEAAGRLSFRAVERATELCLSGEVDAMVTSPISKEAISLAGYASPGHSEFLAYKTGCKSFTMMMVADKLRVGLVTGHIPVAGVSAAVSPELILSRLEIIVASLKQDFAISHPRIAVLGLNPHAGDGGVLGQEEPDKIVPALIESKKRGYHVQGPFPADGFFAAGAYRSFDAVLAMYHDQGLVPFKILAFDTGVNFTAGLPIVRTSPDHGTAYDIAGLGKASPGSLRSAIFLAIDIVRRRWRAQEHEPQS